MGKYQVGGKHGMHIALRRLRTRELLTRLDTLNVQHSYNSINDELNRRSTSRLALAATIATVFAALAAIASVYLALRTIQL